MSDLTDLAALLVGGGGADKAIAAEDPYLEFQGIPDQIGQLILGANQRDEKTGKPVFSTTDRIIGALLSGIVSGGAHSLSEDYQSRAQDAYQKTLLTALSGQEPTKPEVLPEAIFRDAKKQATIFKVVSGLQDKEAAQKYNQERAGKVQDAYLQAGYVPDNIDPQTGEIGYKKIPEIDPASQATSKLRAELELREMFKNNSPDSIPAILQEKLAGSKAVIDEADQIANELERAGTNWAELKSSQIFSGLDKEGIALTLKNLADKLARARTGAAINNQEMKLYQNLVGGDLTADPTQVAFLLRKLANAERRMNTSQLDLLQKFKEGGVQGARSIFAVPAESSIPSPGTIKYTESELAAAGYTPKDIAALRLRGQVQ